MAEVLTVRVRAKGGGVLRAMDAAGNPLPSYVGRGADGAPMPTALPAHREPDGTLVPVDATLRRALQDGDLERVPDAAAPEAAPAHREPDPTKPPTKER